MSPDARPPGFNLPALLLALLVMLGIGALLSTGVVRLLRVLGFFPPEREPVEVFYEPYDDGQRLEDFLGPEERPGALPQWDMDPSTEPASPAPEPASALPPDTIPPPPRPAQPEPR